uniref:EF-hand domain-containing protein n=1 Tax=Cannabis sativa TaxID=3483 RepID=A0A803QY52_CANSA
MVMSKLYLEMEHVFQYFDENGDGKISALELRNRLGVVLVGDELLPLEEAEEAVECLDLDGDGFLVLDDLVNFMESSTHDDHGEKEKLQDLRRAFEIYDMERVGFITPKSLSMMLTRLGESKSIDECKVMIKHFDLNGDGVLSFDEFRIMMQ